MTKKLRLLHIQVQPIYVIDDGDNLTPQPGEPFIVPAADVPGFSAKFVVDFAALQAEFAEAAAADTNEGE